MIYLVTKNRELFDNDLYKIISVEESLFLMKSWKVIQCDSETNGRDAHINKLLCFQFGNDSTDTRIVVDCPTIDILNYKDILESKLLIFQNAKFDLQFLYNYGIHPTNVYDTMIVEQFLHLGFPSGITVDSETYNNYQFNFPYHNINGNYTLSYALDAIAYKRLGVYIDKEIRGQIIWRGLDADVIKYAANDVVYLEKIAKSQVEDLKKIPNGMKGAKIECDFTPVIAYLEWCGIKLDKDKWLNKMHNDYDNLLKAEKELNNFILKTPSLSKYHYYENTLFDEYSGDRFLINWSSSRQVVDVAKILGFNTVVQDKKTGKDKDSVLERQLKNQKGINDEFLKLYFDYQEYAKVVSSFGQGHLNAVNPYTGRIHTVYRAIGSASGRMSCGSQQPNTDLAKLNGVLPKDCTYPNIQQLPSDEITRACFIADDGNLLVDSDFSALESRLGANIYNEPSMIDEYINGSGDIHSLMALTFFGNKMEKGITTKEVKKKYPDLRKAAKGPEFLIQFGGSAFGLAGQLGCSIEEAESFVNKYYDKFKGIANFKQKGSKFVRDNGYVVICKDTGHRMRWWDWCIWKQRQEEFTSDFWEDYKHNHKGTGDNTCLKVKHHFQAVSKWDRMALNAPTQGQGCIILKTAAIMLYKWVLDNNLFGKVKLCALVHDEILAEYPKELIDFPKIVEDTMFKAAAIYCKSVPIPAEAEVSDHWIH